MEAIFNIAAAVGSVESRKDGEVLVLSRKALMRYRQSGKQTVAALEAFCKAVNAQVVFVDDLEAHFAVVPEWVARALVQQPFDWADVVESGDFQPPA